MKFKKMSALIGLLLIGFISNAQSDLEGAKKNELGINPGFLLKSNYTPYLIYKRQLSPNRYLKVSTGLSYEYDVSNSASNEVNSNYQNDRVLKNGGISIAAGIEFRRSLSKKIQFQYTPSLRYGYSHFSAERISGTDHEYSFEKSASQKLGINMAAGLNYRLSDQFSLSLETSIELLFNIANKTHEYEREGIIYSNNSTIKEFEFYQNGISVLSLNYHF